MKGFCVNCGLALKRFKIIACNTLDVLVRLLLEEWVDQSVTDCNVICTPCKDLLHQSVDNGDRIRKLGHSQVCAGCGSSVLRKWVKTLPPDHPTAQMVLSKRPRKLDAVILCRKCDMRHLRSTEKLNGGTKEKKSYKSHNIEEVQKLCLRNKIYDKVPENRDEQNDRLYLPPPTTSQDPNDTISLVNYTRALQRKTVCTMAHCKNKDLHMFPKLIVKMFLVDFNIYVPSRVKICSKHLKEANWKTVADQMKVTETFNRDHVEHALNTLKRRSDSAVDFENVEFMPDSLCKFLTGLKVAEFMELHDTIKWSTGKSKLGLAILLIKLKREPNDDVIAELLGVNDNNVRKELSAAIKCVCKADKAFFDNLEENNMSVKINSSFLSIYGDGKDD